MISKIKPIMVLFKRKRKSVQKADIGTIGTVLNIEQDTIGRMRDGQLVILHDSSKDNFSFSYTTIPVNNHPMFNNIKNGQYITIANFIESLIVNEYGIV